MSSAELLASSQQVFLSAPAGCGKTYLIADAVAHYNTGRELILTHTNAGVAAIRAKLRFHGAAASTYEVNSIAGWALGFAMSFPKTSGITAMPNTPEEWEQVYRATSHVLKVSSARSIVPYSYTGMYVDEYQDCTIAQHNLVLDLARMIRCRVLGDALQGIFGFRKNETICWQRDVETVFQRLPELSEPWRWSDNKELGRWLLLARKTLLAGQPVSLKDAPPSVIWKVLPADQKRHYVAQLKACQDAVTKADHEDSIVVVHKWGRQGQTLAKRLSMGFSTVEPIECDDMFTSLRAIAEAQGADRAVSVVAFAATCMTGVEKNIKTALACVCSGQSPRRTLQSQEQYSCLLKVATDTSIRPVASALMAITAMPGARLFRRELFLDSLKALDSYGSGEYATIDDAIWYVRNRSRYYGRRAAHRSVGTTLLVKGLEFDHVVIVDADTLDVNNLYVAITRGARTLTILSRVPKLTPQVHSA